MMNDIDRIREALQFIPTGGHDERFRIGCMLKSGLGDTGRELWDEWRDGRGDDEASSVWKSISETGPLKIGTLFHEAKANGWRDDGRYHKPTAEELAERKRIAAERTAQEEAEIARERADTAKKAVAIFKAGTDPLDNPYLSRKRVPSVATLREIDASAATAILGYPPNCRGDLLTGRLLVVPVKQGHQLSTVELIDGDGRKAALAGRGSKAGGYWATQRLPDGDGPEPLQFCEGVATTLSTKEATGEISIATLSASNMLTVAMIMRERYPTRPFVFCAELVKATGEPDPHAIEAARAVGGKLAIPDFGSDRDPGSKDFNDLAQLLGAEAVRRIVEAAIPAHPAADRATGSDSAGPEGLPEADYHRNAPVPDPACLYGLFGDIARAGSAGTEANPFAIAAASMAFMGVAIGRRPYFMVGDTAHHVRLNAAHIGRTSKGRKGDALSLPTRIAATMRGIDPSLVPAIHSGGLSSREGLVYMIRDGDEPDEDGQVGDPGVPDKRLLIVESEFANVLQQTARMGNTLSEAIRDLFDGKSIAPATKRERLSATDPHVGMAVGITPGELLSQLGARDRSNGFFNRFLPFWAERTKLVPVPPPTPDDVVCQLADKALDVLRFCGASRWAESNQLQILLSSAAEKLYCTMYHELNVSHGRRVDGLLDRRAPYLRRIAALFALSDQQLIVEPKHLQAALAWIRFSVDSVKFVFASDMDEAAALETASDADRILEFLGQTREATRTQLSNDCFSKHASRSRIDLALDELLARTPPPITVTTVHRAAGSRGSPTKLYKLLRAESADCAESGMDTGPDQNPQRADSFGLCGISRVRGPESATFRNSPQHAESGQALAQSHIPQIPQSPHDMCGTSDESREWSLDESDVEYF